MKPLFAWLLAMVPVIVAQAQYPTPALVGYWHNWNDGSAPYITLDQIDPRYNVVEIAFAEPATGTTCDMVFTPAMTTPAALATAIAGLQAQGGKVLISIGGANATVHLDSDGERDQFASSVLDIITAYSFDGIDIDLEGASVSISGGTITTPTDPSLIRLIQAIGAIMDGYRMQFGRKMFLTMAPETAFVQGGQSAFGGIWGAYLPVIHALRDSLDILQVQLYNSGSMYGIDGSIYAQGTADFIVSQTEAVIQGFNTAGGFFAGLPPEKVAVGLPACASAAGGGYTDTTIVRAAVEYLLGEGPRPGSYTLVQSGGYPALRGLMTWSVNWDAASGCNGAWSFAENHERIFSPLTTTLAEEYPRTIRVFPNPASDLVTLVLDDRHTSENLEVQWTDMRGRTVRTETHPISDLLNLSVHGIPPGSYMLRVGTRLGIPTRTMVVVL